MSPTILIRNAKKNEVKKLQNLNDEAFAENPKFDSDLILDWAQSDIGKSYFTTLLNSQEDYCLVAEDQGKLVGYIAAGPKKISHRKSKYIEIQNLGVVPSYRSQGLGSRLIKACLKRARNKGYQKAYLNSYSANVKAIAFYKSNGFSKIDVSLEKNL